MKTLNIYSKKRTILTSEEMNLGKHIVQLGRYNYSKAHNPLTDHSHMNAVEFAYLVKGRQVYNTGNKDYVLGANDVFVTFPSELHSTANYPEAKGILYWVIVKLPQKRERLFDLPVKESDQLTNSLLNLPNRIFSAPPTLVNLFDNIFFAWFQKQNPLKPIIIKARFIELLTSLIEYAGNAQTQNVCSQINDLLAYIDSNVDKTLGISTLAKRMNLSESWFKAKFLKNVGMSPAQYIMSRKIERAKTLLQHNGRNITDIALSLGFSSSGYFATVFKRFTGQNPSDYMP